jgi:hypothetical protein
MRFEEIVGTLTDILKEFDSSEPVHKNFKPGLGPFGEPQVVGIIAKEFTTRGYASYTRRTPDLDIEHEWAIEFKIVRPFGDNGREAENWSVNMLHPYPGNMSLLGDALKLRKLDNYPCKGLIVIGFEHDPARISIDPLINAFELVAERVMNIHLGPRIESKCDKLIHPEHQVLRCIGWQLEG